MKVWSIFVFGQLQQIPLYVREWVCHLYLCTVSSMLPLNWPFVAYFCESCNSPRPYKRASLLPTQIPFTRGNFDSETFETLRVNPAEFINRRICVCVLKKRGLHPSWTPLGVRFSRTILHYLALLLWTRDLQSSQFLLFDRLWQKLRRGYWLYQHVGVWNWCRASVIESKPESFWAG